MTFPIVTGRRLSRKKAYQVRAEVSGKPGVEAIHSVSCFRNSPNGMKYMFATLCSKPAATKAPMGGSTARILSVTVRTVREPNGQTDECVAEDPGCDCLGRSRGRPCPGDRECRLTDLALTEGVLTRRVHEPGRRHRPDEVPQIDQAPVREQPGRRDSPARQAMTIRLFPVKSSAPPPRPA